MKKLFGCILSLVVAVMLVFTPAEHVYAQGLGLSVSSSSVAVGKTVKVTVSMPSGYFGTVVISGKLSYFQSKSLLSIPQAIS